MTSKPKIGFILKLSWKQMRLHKAFVLTLVLNIALGFIGFTVVSGFNDAFRSEISERSKVIASADLVLSSRQPWNREQEQIIREYATTNFGDYKKSSEINLITMATGGSGTRLVEVRFVDERFPLYSGLRTRLKGSVKDSGFNELQSGEILVHRELLPQLGVDVGSKLQIGDLSLKIADVVEDDPTMGQSSFSFAPRAYVKYGDANFTKLLGLGSRAVYYERFRLGAGKTVPKSQLEDFRQKLSAVDSAQDVRVKSHGELSEETSRIQSFITDYLKLMGLSAIFLASIGTSYLLTALLRRLTKDFAILSALGGSSSLPSSLFVTQCVLIGFVASILALGGSFLVLPLLAKAMSPLTGMSVATHLPAVTLMKAGALAIISSILISFPRLYEISKINPSILLQGRSGGFEGRAIKIWLTYIPAGIFWWIVAGIESESWRVASGFMVFALLLVVLAVAGSRWFLAVLLRFSDSVPLNWRLKLAIRQLCRNHSPTISTFLAVSFGASLLALVPQLKSAVSREIERPDSVIPQLFMFDIQTEQLEGVKSELRQFGAEISSFSPMVRARLEKVNQEQIADRVLYLEGDQEQRQRESLQSRTQNLSYRDSLSSSESLVAGAFQGKPYDGAGVPEVSLEEAFAKRLNIKLGDKMTFDISGVEVEGLVTSIRKVRWTSFQPNFMILFQPGAIDEAPTMWVASAGKIDPARLNEVQTSLVKKFSNVSVVDVKNSVKRLLDLIEKASVAIGMIAWLVILSGIGVLFGISYARSLIRKRDIALLKIFGVSQGQATQSILIEYGFLVTAGVVVGCLLGGIENWAVTRYFFRIEWDPASLFVTWSTILVVPISLIVAWMALRPSLKAEARMLMEDLPEF